MGRRVPTHAVRVLHEPATTPLPVPDNLTASPFSGTWSDTLETLRREAGYLGADEVVLVVDALPGNMRQDGGIRADAKVRSDGVEVYLVGDRGPMRWTCTRFYGGRWGGRSLAGWQANVRAVALGLEALRKVDRYGIADDGQQYAGWRAIGSGEPIAMGAAGMTVEEAARLLRQEADASSPWSWEDLIGAPDLVASFYREAAKYHHPDKGGDPALFRRITEARDLLLTG